SARQHDGVEAPEIGGMVPDVLRPHPHAAESPEDILLAVGAREDDDRHPRRPLRLPCGGPGGGARAHALGPPAGRPSSRSSSSPDASPGSSSGETPTSGPETWIRKSSITGLARNRTQAARTTASAVPGSGASTTSSMRLPTRTSWTSAKPREGRARSIV